MGRRSAGRARRALTRALRAAPPSAGRSKLGKLVEDYGRAMSAYQLGCALALLAGFAAGRPMRDAAGALGAGGGTVAGGGGEGGRDNGGEAKASARQRKAQELVEGCRAAARRCADLLKGRLAAASALDCARWGRTPRPHQRET